MKQASHFYDRKHWDVEEEESCYLERKLRKQTVSAVDDAVDREKLRRMRDERNRHLGAKSMVLTINNELFRLIGFNLEAEKKKIDSIMHDCEDNLDYSLNVLARKANDFKLVRAVEDERERRVSLMNAMTDDNKTASDKEFRNYLKCLAHVNNIWAAIQNELNGAMGDLEVVKAEEEHALDDLYREMKDELVLNFKRSTNSLGSLMQEENEKRRRLAEARAYASGKKQMDKTSTKSMQLKVLSHEELMRLFAGVIQDESQKEARAVRESEIHHDDVMQRMIRRQSIQWADNECALERTRRILEAERESRSGIDYEKERIRDAMQSIQENMIIEKFHGHRIVVPKQTFHTYDEDQFETEQDRKLRQVRMKSRRQSCAVAGMGY
ncbi:uncharacterized protein LOC117113711 [Anneissia japonica]|uniref:uncharacterized protein LOC117113711 n=1 Tax=Anneissia japonica TaxID=1529436 RepID=UPI0014258CF7|nr:uncharacterized protein LOC117113711 [Anneissia japonica]